MRKTRYTNFKSSLLLCSAIAAGAVLSPYANAEEAVSPAHNTNFLLDQQKSILRTSEAEISIAKAALLPEVFLEVRAGVYSREEHLPADVRRQDDGSYNEVSLSVTQTLWDGNQKQNRIAAVKQARSAEKQKFNYLEQQVLMNAMKASLNLQHALSVLQLVKSNLKFMRKQAALETARFDLGQATLTQLSHTKSKAKKAEIEYNFAKLRSEQAKLDLRKHTGSSSLKAQPIKIPAKLLPKTMEDAIEVALAEHPLLIAHEHSINQADYLVKQELAARLPKLSLDGYVSKGSRPRDEAENIYALGLRLKVPLFQEAANQSRVIQKQEIRFRSQLRRDHHANHILESIELIYKTLATARLNLQSAKKAKDEATHSFELALQERNYQLKPTPEMLEAHLFMSKAIIQHFDATRALRAAEFALLFAIGRLNEEWLGLKSEPSSEPVVFEYKNAQPSYGSIVALAANVDYWAGLRVPTVRTPFLRSTAINAFKPAGGMENSR